MKRFLTAMLAMVILVTSMGLFACGGSSSVVDEEVVLIDVGGVETYDLTQAMSNKGKSVVKSKDNLTWTLTSVATGKKFEFSSSEVAIDFIHKEYYLVSVKSKDNEIYSGKFDFYDMDYDGVVWCEWSEYVLGACFGRHPANDKISFEYVSEKLNDSTEITTTSIVYKPYSYAFNLFTVKPFHSKKYYQTYAPYGVLSFSFIRRAAYSFKSGVFKPDEISDHAGHVEGELAKPGTIINFRKFGSSGNQSDFASALNVWQEAEYQMIDIIDYFDKIGDSKNGAEWWYFLGTCHNGSGNPYEIMFYINAIDIY